jgi:NAD(P)-dependent dehydrogenase (short-subunit alcohol dehydrogenase family)
VTETQRERPPHALVVGGSGMLAATCRALADQGWHVSVVGRDRAKLARAASDHPAITPISVDYRDCRRFRRALDDASDRHGPVELAVCWIRSSAPGALEIVADLLAHSGRLLHVLGSASMADAMDGGSLPDRLGHRYTRVILGGVTSGGAWRWLTDAEIDAGVRQALASRRSRSVVGMLERPPG